MKVLDILRENKQKLFAIGDSHAVAIGSQPGFVNLSKNGRRAEDPANDAAVAQVPNGSLVVLSAGANNMLDPNKQGVVARVESLINKLKQKQCSVYYVLFAATDHPKFAQDRNQLRQLVQAAIDSDVTILDMGSLKYKAGDKSQDGIHAPMSWYVQAARKAAGGAKTIAVQPTVASAQKAQPTGETAGALAEPQGRVGPAVADIQKVLLALGYQLPKHGVDGVRGPETSGVIKQFQRENGLAVDGDPGPETVGALNKVIVSKNIKFTKSTQADVKGKFLSSGDPQDVGDIMNDNDPSVLEGRNSAERYLGRKMSDEEWTALVKVTAAEESDTKAMAYVMGAILNRVNRGTWGNDVVRVVSAPRQFEPVTGPRGNDKRLHLLPIPGGRKLKAILTGAKEILPSVPKKIVNFTSNIDAAYKGRASISYKYKLLARGGEVIGNSVFAA